MRSNLHVHELEKKNQKNKINCNQRTPHEEMTRAPTSCHNLCTFYTVKPKTPEKVVDFKLKSNFVLCVDLNIVYFVKN